MTFAPDAARILALVSAGGLLLLAVAFLILPRRDARARAFAAFAALWALQVAAVNVGASQTDTIDARRSFALEVAAFTPLYLPLAYFASAYPLRDGIFSRSRLALALLCLPGLVTATLLLVRPEWIVGAVSDDLPTIVRQPGPLFSWLVSLPFVAALAYAVRRFGRDARAEGTPLLSTRAALLATAFALYLAYVGPGYVLLFGSLVASSPSVLFAGNLASYAVAAVATALCIRDLLASRWSARWRAVAVIALAAATGLAESIFILQGTTLGPLQLDRLDTVGIWRIGMVGLVLYALARHQMFDLHARVGRRYADTRFQRERRLDVYRAALEEALAKAEESEEDRLWLATLRESLDITDLEHRAIDQSVRASLAAGGRPAREASGPELYRGRFRILRVLGGGGGGQAILAEDAQLGRRVVLKELGRAQRRDPGAVASLLHEASVMATISHPHVVTILEVDRSEDDPVVVLEHCAGGSVEDRVLREGPLAPRDAVAITRDALEGLAAIHARGLVHRDIKPANLLLTVDGRAKVADFGLAQAAAHAPTTSTMAIERAQPGTLPYMSPEQLRTPRLDARSDLYSLAAACHWMCTAAPYYGDGPQSAEAIREAILAGRHDLSKAPAALRPFLAKGLARERGARYQSAEEMLAALPEGEDVTARAPGSA